MVCHPQEGTLCEGIWGKSDKKNTKEQLDFPCSIVRFHKPRVAQDFRKFLLHFTQSHSLFLFWTNWIHTLPSCFLKTHFSTILPSSSTFSKWCLSRGFLYQHSTYCIYSYFRMYFPIQFTSWGKTKGWYLPNKFNSSHYPWACQKEHNKARLKRNYVKTSPCFKLSNSSKYERYQTLV